MAQNPYQSEVNPKQTSGGALRTFLVSGGLIVLAIMLLLPFRRDAREAARRSQCRNNLKQIGLALHNYHEDHGSFPPAYTVAADGTPLHSWRTLLLPYLDQNNLYQRVDLSKPWSHPDNAFLMGHSVPCYRCPSATIPKGQTIYLGVAAPGGCFEPGRTTKISEITDGTTNTLIVVEVPAVQSVPWMAPYDADGRFLLTLPPDEAEDDEQRLSLSHDGVIMGLMADGSVQALSRSIDAETLGNLIDIDDGEIVGEF